MCAWKHVLLVVFILFGFNHKGFSASEGNDFSDFDWRSQTTAELSSGWYYVSEKFLSEADIRSGAWKNFEPMPITLPSGLPSPRSAPANPAWGTLILELKNFHPPFRDLGLRLRGDTAFQFFWLDGESEKNWEQVLKVGVPAAKKSESIPQISDEVARIRADGSGHYYLVAHISGHYYTSASIWTKPVIGAYRPLYFGIRLQETLEALVCGMIFMMGVYYVSMVFHQRENKASLLLAAFAFTNFLRLMATSPNISLSFFPEASVLVYELIRKCEFGLLMLNGSTGFLFAIRSLAFDRLEKFGRWMVYLSGFVTVFCLFTTVEVYQKFLLVMNVYLLSMILVSVAISVLAYRRQRVGSVALLFGATVMLGTSIFDMFAGLGVINSPIFYAPFGFTIFIFCQGQVMSQLFSKAFRTAQRLSGHLQEEVERQTTEIRTMLNSIPQGVLSFVEGAVADGSYSDHMKSILEEDSIAGRTLDDLLLRRSSLSADAKDRILATMEACIGSDVLSFELNADQLPREIELVIGARKKILEVTWNPIVDKDRLVRKMLVTLHDVTDMRAFEAESQNQKIEFQYIQEIVSIPQERFDRFMESTTSFIEENIRLIEANNTKNMDILKILFVNMHTIKGAARTLGLKLMADVLHEVEHYYSDMLKHAELDWDNNRLQSDILRAKEQVGRYADINSRVLGRTSISEQTVSLDRKILIEQLDILSRLPIEAINEDLRHSLNEARNILKEIVYLPIRAVIEELLEGTDKIAQDLGKAPPEIELLIEDYFVTQECSSILRHSFTHILRNALDHGIEAPDERVAAGKSPEGCIRVALSVRPDGLELSFSDDGRGLNLQKLRSKGLELGLLPADREPRAEELAELIFHSGLSTAEQVNQFSGRGVGMGAVRQYIEAAGGKVVLELSPASQPRTGRAFRLLIHLPAELVYVQEELPTG